MTSVARPELAQRPADPVRPPSDYASHSLSCGQFGGECTTEASCGSAPRRPNAVCPTAGHVCCVWLL